jgi:hypothetical protein
MKELFLVGFWENREKNNGFIHPECLINNNLSESLKYKIISYLRSKNILLPYAGYSYCRFADGPSDELMGCCDITDGFWVWPEGLPVYIEKYNIHLPKDFIDHMRKSGFKINQKLDLEEMTTQFVKKELVYNTDFWKDWCNNYMKNGTELSVYDYVKYPHQKESRWKQMKPFWKKVKQTLKKDLF